MKMMKLRIIRTSGTIYELECPINESVQYLKNVVSSKSAIPKNTIRLMYCGKELKPDKGRLQKFKIGSHENYNIHMSTTVVEIVSESGEENKSEMPLPLPPYFNRADPVLIDSHPSISETEPQPSLLRSHRRSRDSASTTPSSSSVPVFIDLTNDNLSSHPLSSLSLPSVSSSSHTMPAPRSIDRKREREREDESGVQRKKEKRLSRTRTQGSADHAARVQRALSQRLYLLHQTREEEREREREREDEEDEESEPETAVF
eukprot:CAMPEP_0182437156 /NCGR_PEP_ID=MMETSP1167-20130531/84849_1 /TAXON_ID=2988 /ORGANISM="Mallomonas Sp, Strain CCMP3275" /LENGTH=259 /DNA_ID=CAMNT_0024629969 /DNA_START=136 /DNA_END=915 /DNA_ORIENTATION=-